MAIPLTDTQRAALEAAAGSEPHVRRWKRHRVLLVRAKGLSVVAVATALDCNQASVFAGGRAARTPRHRLRVPLV